jgi:hypothetical protein
VYFTLNACAIAKRSCTSLQATANVDFDLTNYIHSLRTTVTIKTRCHISCHTLSLVTNLESRSRRLRVPARCSFAVASSRVLEREGAHLPSQPHLAIHHIRLHRHGPSLPAMPSSSSIQSYFSPSPTKNSDGFTTDEVLSTVQPAEAWTVGSKTRVHSAHTDFDSPQ